MNSNFTKLSFLRIKVILCLTIVFHCENLMGQNETDTTNFSRLVKFPLFTSEFIHYPATNYDQNKLLLSEVRTAVNLGFPLDNNQTILTSRLVHSYFSFEAEHNLTGTQVNKYYQSIAVGIGFVRMLKKNWKISFMLMPTIASDFVEPLHADDWIFQTSFLATKRVDKNIEYGTGLIYTTTFGRPMILPLLNYLRKKNNWTTIIYLPAYLAHYFEPSDKFRLGFKATVFGNLYNANFDSYQLNELEFANRVSYTRILIGPDSHMNIFGDFYINLSAGLSVRNRIEIQDDNLNMKGSINTDIKPYINVGIKLLK
ncbi:DUF6268 family outer membrane beta-barrel protein [Aureibacter tunicatorum]|uniref:DUF6268 domain-containing protein n=1 Tax=Aureibacter tunicatorum TaxID=866807 RepID=A0AAE4BQM8_9BACT|nr:DUF6268 family outer membrane beta-barrel protein [Aureibacter tunicatorum]MDR6239304.1 hypothetical protein [Aureibacter tunicatorum]BDD04772.1 hypothetical protein AUTU_22550 [Aureibacter tunicatorum]